MSPNFGVHFEGKELKTRCSQLLRLIKLRTQNSNPNALILSTVNEDYEFEWTINAMLHLHHFGIVEKFSSICPDIFLDRHFLHAPKGSENAEAPEV